MTKDDALKLALETLQKLSDTEEVDDVIAAIKEALAEPDDMQRNTTWNGWILREVYFKDGEPLGHRERPWVGLTDEEVGALTVFNGLHHVEVPVLADFIRAIEAKIKEKNGG